MSKQVFKNNNKWGILARAMMITMLLSLTFSSVAFAGRYKTSDAWSFGVHGDTQWTLTENLEDNPEYVAAAMINALNDEFIANGVKFVIQTGDLTDRGTAAGYLSRAEAAQKLYDNGIGFFPIRGNHETFESTYYPDSNNPPVKFALDMNLPTYRSAFPQTQGNGNTFGATNFSKPSDVLTGAEVLNGLSYSFDYGKSGSNAKFVFVDTEATGYVRYIPTKHPKYGEPYLWMFWTVYDLFLGNPVYDTDDTPEKRKLFKAVYAEDGSMILNMYDIAGNELHSIWDVKRTLLSSKYVNNIIRVLFDGSGNFITGYYDISGNSIDAVYREDGSIFAPSYDGESGWKAEVIYGADGKEITALYDCARHMIPAVYDINHKPIAFYDKADPATRKQLGIKDLEFWVRIGSNTKLSTNMYGYEKTYPLTDWTILDLPSWKTAGTEFFPGKQQAWINAQLDKNTRGTTQAFVFSHRPVINGNHTDSFFGSSSAVTPADQNAFYASLANNDVKFMISGHDHLYNRAIDKSPDGSSQIMQIITQGASTKFYTPTKLEDFGADASPYTTKVKDRETQISQEVKNFGYYIYTVDGPRVTVDYYSDSVGNFVDGTGYPDNTGSLAVPDFEFAKQEEWGYDNLNGKQTIVAQGGSYAGIEGTFNGTTAKILAGTNKSTSKDMTPVNTDNVATYGIGGPRPFVKTVNTGWVAKPVSNANMLSNIFSIWGMSELGVDLNKTDTYVLSMSYSSLPSSLILGNIGIATYTNGKWINAVKENISTTDAPNKVRFVYGAWKDTYPLGTYGFNPATKTVWAVLNYNADFAVANGIR